jgi:hypothetical protein
MTGSSACRFSLVLVLFRVVVVCRVVGVLEVFACWRIWWFSTPWCWMNGGSSRRSTDKEMPLSLGDRLKYSQELAVSQPHDALHNPLVTRACLQGRRTRRKSRTISRRLLPLLNRAACATPDVGSQAVALPMGPSSGVFRGGLTRTSWHYQLALLATREYRGLEARSLRVRSNFDSDQTPGCLRITATTATGLQYGTGSEQLFSSPGAGCFHGVHL